MALLYELGDFEPPLIVLGGLVPDMLTRDQDVPVPKDYYDFVYVLLYNRLGGPGLAAMALRQGVFGEQYRSTRLTRVWQEIADRFETPDRIGAKTLSIRLTSG